MNNELIQKSILKQEIQLYSIEKMLHYKLSIILFVIAMFSLLIYNENRLKFEIDFENSSFKIGVILLLLSLISFLYQKSNLKLKAIIVKDSKDKVFERIIVIAKNNNWEIDCQTDNSIILKTKRPFSPSRYFISKSYGEKIFVFFKPTEILLRSIHDFDRSYSFVVSSGENIENENYIRRLI
jgi:bifunctional DNase/RNase